MLDALFAAIKSCPCKTVICFRSGLFNPTNNKKNISHESGVVSMLANTSPHHNDLLIPSISCDILLSIVSYPPSKTTEVSNIQSTDRLVATSQPPLQIFCTTLKTLPAGHTIRKSFSVIGHPIKLTNGSKECTKNMDLDSSLGCFFKIIKTI